MIPIGDQRIEQILVKENHDPLIDLTIEFPSLKFDLSRKYVQKNSHNITFARKEIGHMLFAAQKSLPSNYHLLLKECYRPISVQKQFWENYIAFLRKNNPMWESDRLHQECSKYVAPVTVAPHSTGGAVDLLLIDNKGEWFDMGSRFNAEPSESEKRAYFSCDIISSEAKKNRKILQAALEHVGFVNYPFEWWHWSYGDKYWAYVTKSESAKYSSLDL